MSRLNTPLECLAKALHHAAFVGLPDLEYETRDFQAWYALSKEERTSMQAKGQYPTKQVVCRPAVDQCEVHAMFPQLWGSTALGFGGIGGAAMTYAYTVVVKGPAGHLLVYWGGHPAYFVEPAKQTPEQRALWLEDLAKSHTISLSEAPARYGAQSLRER